MTKLNDKAMTAGLRISAWSARKHDKSISAEVASNHGTSIDAGRYNKVLIAKGALADINTAIGAARTFHAVNTLPWLDDGARILPSANYWTYTESMRAYRATFDAAVRSFLDSYPDVIADARVRLNGLFEESDYPSVREIARRFSFDVVVLPLPDAADFRVDINDSEVSRIRAEIQDRTNQAIADAVKDTWSRVHDVVSRMAERLRAYSVTAGKVNAPFRDSLVSNVRDLVELLPRLNVTGDSALDAMAQRLNDSLCAADPQALREDAGLRATVARDAESIMADMAGYFAEDAQPIAA